MTSPTATPRLTRRPLSPKQREIMSYVEGYMDTAKSSPTLYLIVQHCNVRTIESARAHLQKIAKKGWITFDATVEQGIVLVEVPE